MGPFGRDRALLALLAVASVLAVAAPARAQSFSDEAVEKAIKKGTDWLWAHYDEATGHWPEPLTAATQWRPSYEGGHTALACYALLASGESYQEPRLKKALDWLAKIKMEGTSLGIRCQVWALLPREVGRELLAKDAKQLMDSMPVPPKAPPPALTSSMWERYGWYTYLADGKDHGGSDHSNAQYGILGVWAAARANIEIPKAYWEIVLNHFAHTQHADGGWGYSASQSEASYGSMSAAGLASAFVAFDFVSQDQFTKCGLNTDIPVLKNGLEWFEKNFSPTDNPGRRGGYYNYYMYGVERIGLASGYKFFGAKDWYKLGAMNLVAKQAGQGNWGELPDTVFSLLFLVRGRNPILFNRLEYEGDWNNRPRALANLMRWISSKFEGEVNWQIIHLKAPVEDWHDAPILLITGSKAPKFSDADLVKLRTFVQQGGMILSIGECGAQGGPFNTAMRAYYGKLFPQYELTPLPEDHQLFSLHFPVRKTQGVSGVSNGVRILALHVNDDLPLSWQTNAYATGEHAFNLAFNIFKFASDHGSLRHRGTSLWPEDAAFTPLRVAKVARIKHNGNWDPEPLAWARFARVAGQKWQLKLTVNDPVTFDQLKAEDAKVAHVTGTGSLSLSTAEKQGLKAYVVAGGTVILDAAGGSDAFSTSVYKVMDELFGANAVQPLPAFSPVYEQAGMELKQARFRRAAREKLGNAKAARILAVTVAGRPAVFLSKEDLTEGLLAGPCYTCIGYEPETAAEVMRNLVLFGHRSATPTAEPTSGPASAPASEPATQSTATTQPTGAPQPAATRPAPMAQPMTAKSATGAQP